jgi:hypothetical protein
MATIGSWNMQQATIFIIQYSLRVCVCTGCSSHNVSSVRSHERFKITHSGEEVKGKLGNGVGIQYSTHYVGIFTDFNQMCILSTIFIEKSAIPNFTEIPPLGATMIYEDRQTDMTFIYYSSVRVQLKCDSTRWLTGGEVKGKLANGVGSQYSSHYLGTWYIQHYYRWCEHLGCQ